MRPVNRGASPRAVDYENYADAQPHLVSRLGAYCSYCERRIATNLAVEHIEPKGVPALAHLVGRWANFLLACVNCNSTKGDKVFALADIFLPDRDNTLAAFAYLQDGTVHPASAAAKLGFGPTAKRTLALTGLHKKIVITTDENGKQIAIDRVSQRLEVWLAAGEARDVIEADPANESLRRAAVRTAQGYGFFSIWMAVFEADPAMRQQLIDAFPGTRNSGCFDAGNSGLVSPHPNADGLPHGSKI